MAQAHYLNFCQGDKNNWILEKEPTKLPTGHQEPGKPDPKLDYGSVVWDSYQQHLIKRLEDAQRKAARFATGDYSSREPGSVHVYHATPTGLGTTGTLKGQEPSHHVLQNLPSHSGPSLAKHHQ